MTQASLLSNMTRNSFSRPQARKVEDALLALSKSPAYPSMTQLKIAEYLTGACGFKVTEGNLGTAAEAVGISLPGRVKSFNPIEARLQQVEDALTFIIKNWGQPNDRGVAEQMAIVRKHWLDTHPTT